MAAGERPTGFWRYCFSDRSAHRVAHGVLRMDAFGDDKMQRRTVILPIYMVKATGFNKYTTSYLLALIMGRNDRVGRCVPLLLVALVQEFCKTEIEKHCILQNSPMLHVARYQNIRLTRFTPSTSASTSSRVL